MWFICVSINGQYMFPPKMDLKFACYIKLTGLLTLRALCEQKEAHIFLGETGGGGVGVFNFAGIEIYGY